MVFCGHSLMGTPIQLQEDEICRATVSAYDKVDEAILSRLLFSCTKLQWTKLPIQ